MIRALCLCFVLGVTSAQANPVAEAEAAVAQLQAAANALVAADTAEDRIASLTQTVRAYEAGLSALRAGMRQAEIRARVIETRLTQDEAKLGDLLAALQIIQRTPAQVLLIHPSGPIGSARAGMMVAELTPGLQQQADALRRDFEDLTLIRQTQDAALTQLQTGLTGAQTARAALATAMSEREGVPPAQPDRAMLQALLQSSDSLSAFAVGLGGLEQLPTPSQNFADLRGALPLPVSGTRLRGFNEADQAGITRPGLVLAVSAGALVTAPVAATVRYAGPLLDYGNVIVLEPEADTLLIIAGLGTVFTRTGDIPGAGAPLGLIAGQAALSGGIDGGQTRRETLYLELRQNQQPIDPAGWFVNDED